MTPRTWPKSVLPAQRGHSWNTALDLMAGAFRGVREGERVMAVTVVVKDGQGRCWRAVADGDGTRRVGGEDLSDEPEAVA